MEVERAARVRGLVLHALQIHGVSHRAADSGLNEP